MTTLTLIRGLPGSGKSTYAKRLREQVACTNGLFPIIFEADQYFEQSDGSYLFKPSELGYAHEQCQRLTRYTLERGSSAIVANTFTTLHELQPYLDMAHKLNIAVDILTCRGNFQSIHNVPAQSIDRMAQRWQSIPGEVFI